MPRIYKYYYADTYYSLDELEYYYIGESVEDIFYKKATQGNKAFAYIDPSITVLQFKFKETGIFPDQLDFEVYDVHGSFISSTYYTHKLTVDDINKWKEFLMRQKWYQNI